VEHANLTVLRADALDPVSVRSARGADAVLSGIGAAGRHDRASGIHLGARCGRGDDRRRCQAHLVVSAHR